MGVDLHQGGRKSFTSIATHSAAPLPAVFVQAAPVAVRYSVLSIGGNLGYTLFGGFAPVIINLLFHWHGRVAVTIYLVSSCFISLFCLWFLQYLKRHPFFS